MIVMDSWEQIGNDLGTIVENNSTGRSVSVNNDGTIIAVGEQNKVTIFKNNGISWIQLGETLEELDEWSDFGRSCLFK